MFRESRIFLSTLLMIALLLTGTLATAQDAPEQVNIVLQDLANRLGLSGLTLGDMDNWSWDENVFGDTSLGCPQPNQVYSQVTTRGYVFILTYEGVTYDYRISTDGTILILCSTTSTGTPTAIPTVPAGQPTSTPGATGDCTDLVLGFTTGQLGRAVGNLNSNLRAEPSVDAADIGDIQPGGVFTIVGGPTCAGGLWWWQIQTGTQTGWVAQGENGLYFIAPVPTNLPPVTSLDTITATNVQNITALSTVQENLRADMTYSPDGSTLAIVSSNVVNTGIWFYNLNNLAGEAPRFIATPALVTALDYTPDGTMLATGDTTGTVIFWDLTTEEEVFSFEAHQGDVVDMVFSPDGRILATLGASNDAAFWGVPLSAGGSGR